MSAFQATTPPLQAMRIMSVKDVASVIGLSPSYIRNEIRKQPRSFPPVLKGKKNTRLRFRECDVADWLANQSIQKRGVRS